MSFGNTDSGLCKDCGSLLKEVIWCDNDSCECSSECPSYPDTNGFDCVMLGVKLRCPKCETIVDAE